MTAAQEKHTPSPRQAWRFLALTLGLTWAIEFLGAFLVPSAPPWIITLCHYLGGAMPFIITLVLLFTQHESAFRREFWQRLMDLRRIRPVWWAVALLFVPLKSLLAALIDLLLGGWGITANEITRLLAQPLQIVPTLLFWLIFGPLPEEPGWRGYALDGLLEKHGPLLSSLAVGAVWALWHLPLFFIKGTWQAEVVVLGSQRFWIYETSILLEAFIYTWIFQNTRRSILAAIVFHFVTNSFGQLFDLSPRAEGINFALLVLAVALVIAWWRKTPTSK